MTAPLNAKVKLAKSKVDCLFHSLEHTAHDLKTSWCVSW